MRNSPILGEALAFLHESRVTPCLLNGLTVKKRRLRLFGANTSIPISPNPPEPSPPLSHAAASLPRCQCRAQSLVEEYAFMTVVRRRLHLKPFRCYFPASFRHAAIVSAPKMIPRTEM